MSYIFPQLKNLLLTSVIVHLNQYILHLNLTSIKLIQTTKIIIITDPNDSKLRHLFIVYSLEITKYLLVRTVTGNEVSDIIPISTIMIKV